MKVGIEVKNNRYRLRLPAQIATGSQRYYSTGLTEGSDNFKRVQSVAWQIEADIQAGSLDITLERYISAFKPQKVSLAPKHTLSELWERYETFKRPQVSETTYNRDYRKYRNHIAALPIKEPKAANQILDYCINALSPDATRRLVLHLNACCTWAVSQGLIDRNHFEGLTTKIRVPGSQQIDPFSPSEAKAILEAFKSNKPQWYPFVAFTFLTGCRTGEAIALRRSSVTATHIIFQESYDGQLKTTKTTKTGKSRRFPINPDLRSLLDSLPKTRLVFPSPSGDYINNGKFTTQVWKGGGKYTGILEPLIKSGQVARYRPPYNARHTFITNMINQGVPIPTVARWVGNSPEIILRHYAGFMDGLAVPSLPY